MPLFFCGVVCIENIGHFIDRDTTTIVFNVNNNLFRIIVNLNEDGTSLDQFVFTCFFDLLFLTARSVRPVTSYSVKMLSLYCG